VHVKAATLAGVLVVTIAASAAFVAAQGFDANPDPRPTGTVPAGRPALPGFDMEAAEDVLPVQAQAVAPAADGAAPPVVDESALRYFARQGDQRRLEIEIARLRLLYPDWTPPADPLAVPVNVDTQLEAVWQLYAEQKYAEARRAVAERRAAEPDWVPPKDLLDRLDVAEARERLVNASNLKQYETVIRVASETPSLLTCSEVDVLWRVGEAFAETDRDARGRDAYRYILTNCEEPRERLATMQNALRLLPDEMVQELLSQERFDPAGVGEFATVRDDIARRAVAQGGESASVKVPPEQLARVETLAERDGKASDSLLLGWYHLRRAGNADAEKWFGKARDVEDSAEASQGLALALVARKAFQEAETILHPWRDANEDTKSSYLAAVANLLSVEPRVVLEPEVLQRMAVAVAEARDVAAAQQFGWYARAFVQPATAAQWFAMALSWDPDDEPSAYGLALTRHQLGDEAGLAELKRLWAGRSERIVAVGLATAQPSQRQLSAPPALPLQPAPEMATQTPVSAAAAAHPSIPAEPAAGTPALAYAAEPQPRPRAAAPRAAASSVRAAPARRQGCIDTIPADTLPPQAALDRGWCLMDRNRPMEAAEAFERALRSSSSQSRSDAAYGQSLAYLRAGLLDDASVAAAKAPLARPRVAELQSTILAERALAAFEKGRYVEALIALDQRTEIADERIDLMVLRGYAYLRLNRISEAERMFEATAAVGNRDGIRGLANVRELRRGKQP
jgi:tetratricopeptide (TPR) repeat protein